MPRIALHTFGCKINQYETQGMGEALVRAGHALTQNDAGAEIHVINTCTVTETSDAQCRQLVRRIVRANPAARVVVTGCYAERDPETIAQIPGVARVVGHAEKGRIAEHVASILASDSARLIARSPLAGSAYDETPVTFFGSRTRATVKVQDGCDKQCGFCIIPAVRGKSRSRSTRDVLLEIERLIGAGHLEIVLAGIHLGSWRDDATGEKLDALVERILRVPGLRRLRLSSLEPQHLTDRLLDLVSEPVLMPFFHLPLQAGDDSVLRLMRRGYTTALFASRVEKLVARRPDVGIGSDILVGYPGEDDAAFERGLAFIASLPFSHFHVFTFSARPGTHAAALDGAVPPAIRKQRGARMRALGDAKAAAFRARFDGARAEVLVESKRTRDGRLTGLTGNYIRVEMPARPELVNRIVPAILHEAPARASGAMIAIPEAA
jgi:threonylcarbamoyladenosine tRNA methylthiotransferase MtaB